MWVRGIDFTSFYHLSIGGTRVAQWVRSLDLTGHKAYHQFGVFAPGFVYYKKWYTRLATASIKVYQLLTHDRWFSPGTQASSATKTGRHDIAEILLKVALKHQKSNQSIYWILELVWQVLYFRCFSFYYNVGYVMCRVQ